MAETGEEKFQLAAAAPLRRVLMGRHDAAIDEDVLTRLNAYLAKIEAANQRGEREYRLIIRRLLDEHAQHAALPRRRGQLYRLLDRMENALSPEELQRLRQDVETLFEGADDVAGGAAPTPVGAADTQTHPPQVSRIRGELTALVEQTVALNQRFGEQMKTGLAALRDAASAESIDLVGQGLLDQLESMVGEQHRVIAELNRAHGDLHAIADQSLRLNEELRRVKRLSLTDDLTGLPNRRALTKRLEDELSRAQRAAHTFSFVMIDLDGFKAINDIHGHCVGDAVLRRYAELLVSTFRHHDQVARYGGEEFAAILPYTQRDEALAAIRKLRATVRQASCCYEDLSLSLPTFSAGIALFREGDSLLSLINRADKAMYRAKRLGRDRCEVDAGRRRRRQQG